jgi:hypothetical protein
MLLFYSLPFFLSFSILIMPTNLNLNSHDPRTEAMSYNNTNSILQTRLKNISGGKKRRTTRKKRSRRRKKHRTFTGGNSPAPQYSNLSLNPNSQQIQGTGNSVAYLNKLSLEQSKYDGSAKL